MNNFMNQERIRILERRRAELQDVDNAENK